MNKFDKEIEVCLRDYQLKEFIESRYIPYFYLRNRIRACLKKLKGEIENGKYGLNLICICDIHTSKWVKKWISYDALNVNVIIVNEGGRDKELAESITNELNKYDDNTTIIGVTGYQLNQRVTSAIYGLGHGNRYIDSYIYMEDLGVHTCKTNLIIERDTKKETLKQMLTLVHLLLALLLF